MDHKTAPDRKYLLALAAFPKFGPVRLEKVKKAFPDWQTAFRASAQDLAAAGIDAKIAQEFAAARAALDPDALMAAAARENITIVVKGEPGYPKLLSEIYDPPALLYCRGPLREKDELGLAVVGTRKHTDYGRQAAERIVRGLVENGLTIISGLAHGIDTIAHRTALEERGRTIAVLGSGLDRRSVYPAANRYLADRIAQSGGLVVSEFPLGTPPLKHHFPRRNRIIAGLALGTVVIEAAEKSGALITARAALEENREVFALPGSIFSPVSAGPNALIKEGAKAIASANDIIEALDLKAATSYIENKNILPGTPAEELVHARLSHEAVHIDELIRLTGLPAGAVLSTLTVMEMKGLVKNLGNMQYVRAR